MLRSIVKVASVLGAVCCVGGVGAGCLDRPVTSSGATTKTNFTASVTQNAIDKVDLLFDIDNSASMGDKQEYLAQAVPDLVTRLVQPNCVNVTQTSTTIAGRSTNGSCAAFAGSTIEFPPVHNMHIGVISSSLGTRGVQSGGKVCDPSLQTNPFPSNPALSAHDDDRAELLNRTATTPYTEGTSADVGAQNFLDWFPTGTGWAVNTGKTPTGGVQQSLSPNAAVIADAMQLETDFVNLIVGAHYYGCGIESQLESWYRFLIQPDPYDSIAIDTMNHAQWNSIDGTIIKQRHDFLRPDSLVAIIDLTDENDSEIDVRSFGGQGYEFMDQGFNPPRGTAACTTTPESPLCTSCAYPGHSADPSCKMGAYMAADDPGFYINVRHVHMQQKYGIVPQFPLGRYVLGLSSPKVPDRFHEYPAGASSYAGGTLYDTSKSPAVLKDPQDLNCTNPLFAAKLPDGTDLSPNTLCNAAGAGGSRTPDLIFYAHIGGVPHELLQSVPGDGTCPTGTSPQDCPQKDILKPADWVKILGQGWSSLPAPASAPNVNEYNYMGIDPHMIESFGPRPGLLALGTGPNPTGGGGDPVNGGEWVTNGSTPPHSLPVDREYACIFPLATPRDCTATDYSVQEACDCSVAGLPLNAVPAVCGTQSGGPYQKGTNEYTKQYYAKTYPTIRELQLAELMGTQGIISSLCPIHPTDLMGGNDPLYGYRPAITAIVNRLKNALATQCLPEKLNPQPTGKMTLEVQCLILATLSTSNPANVIGNESKLCNDAAQGLSQASTPTELAVLKAFQQSQHAEWMATGHGTPDPSTFSTCLVNQIPYTPNASCAAAPSGAPQGWCYVTDPKYTGQCAQAIQFTPGTPPQGAVVSLQCIEAQANIVGATSDGGGG